MSKVPVVLNLIKQPKPKDGISKIEPYSMPFGTVIEAEYKDLSDKRE